jgi:ribosomal protein S18 acetylase RimI-like enzyme
MRVRLRDVRDEELAAVLDSLQRFYANDLERNGGLSRAEAERKATNDQAALVEDGRPIAGTHLLVVEDENGEAIGRVWYGDRSPDVFLYAIELDEAVRGRGYGREAMQAFETLVRERGVAAIWLNVFGGNDIARSLYRSLDYAESSVHMSKRLT